jgi:hypothetical protein
MFDVKKLSILQLLLENGAQLFIENKECLTSCDLAEKQGHRALALFLESKMIFSEVSQFYHSSCLSE